MLLEREQALARHQTGRNSGVIHAGIYYAPGSLKARLCVQGARELYEYCEERGVPFARSGKLIVARTDAELQGLDELFPRAQPVVCLLDGHPHTLSFLGAVRAVPIACLGVQRFGQSGDIAELYEHHQIDAEAVIGAALDLLG